MKNQNSKKRKREGSMSPVTIPEGFRVSEKTTSFVHMGKSNQDKENPFKCTVIMNDFAQHNVDKAFRNRSHIIPSEEDPISFCSL